MYVCVCVCDTTFIMGTRQGDARCMITDNIVVWGARCIIMQFRALILVGFREGNLHVRLSLSVESVRVICYGGIVLYKKFPPEFKLIYKRLMVVFTQS